MEKTCGNCGHFTRDRESQHLGICGVCYFETENGVDVYCAVRDVQQCASPGDYIAATDTLEQRYQQLEQVAREMITALEVAYIAVGTSREWNSYVIKGYKKRLEELGVEL